MTKVYILYKHDLYGTDIIGVFSSKDKMIDGAKNKYKDRIQKGIIVDIKYVCYDLGLDYWESELDA